MSNIYLKYSTFEEVLGNNTRLPVVIVEAPEIVSSGKFGPQLQLDIAIGETIVTMQCAARLFDTFNDTVDHDGQMHYAAVVDDAYTLFFFDKEGKLAVTKRYHTDMSKCGTTVAKKISSAKKDLIAAAAKYQSKTA